MADYLTDEEQLQALKKWWKDNGISILASVLLGLTTYFGFQWWQNSQQQQSEQASAIYAELLELFDPQKAEQLLSEENQSIVKFLTEQLQQDYSNSLFAVNASFYAAKAAVDTDKLGEAEKALQWVIDNGDESMHSLAKLRLAKVLFAQEKYDDALSLLESEEVNNFASLIAETKGDIYVAQEDWANARSSYKEAVNTLENATSYRGNLLPIKIDNLPAENTE